MNENNNVISILYESREKCSLILTLIQNQKASKLQKIMKNSKMKIEILNLHQFTQLIQTKRIQTYFFEYSRLQEIIIEVNLEDFFSLSEQI